MNWPAAIASLIIMLWVALICWVAIYHGAEVDSSADEDYRSPAESREHE